MHLAIALFTIFAAWRWADWRNWPQYHATMLFITAGGLLYEYLTKDHMLWMFTPDVLQKQQLTVIVYAVVVMPLCVLIFLSQYPSGGWISKALYYLMWDSIYAVVEWVLQCFARISYGHGWNFWYSVLFDMIMFPMLRLHYLKPVWAYSLSIMIIVFLMLHFHIPLK